MKLKKTQTSTSNSSLTKLGFNANSNSCLYFNKSNNREHKNIHSDWPAVSNLSFWQELRTPIDKKGDHNQYDRHWWINSYNIEKLPNFPSRKNNQFKMRDIQFVKNQFVSRIPKSLQTCFRASLEKAFSNPLGTEVVLEQTNHRKCCECDIHILEFWSGNKDPPKVLWQYWWPWIFRILRNKKDLNKKIRSFSILSPKI